MKRSQPNSKAKSRSKSRSTPRETSKPNPNAKRLHSSSKAQSKLRSSTHRSSQRTSQSRNRSRWSPQDVVTGLRELEIKAEDLRETLEARVWGKQSKSEKQRMRARLLLTTAVVACVISVSSYANGDDLGISLIAPRVVRGEAATRGRFLYAANLVRTPGGHICGGSLVRDEFVLTAAHCVQEMIHFPWSYKVLVGNYNLRKPEEEEEVFQVLDVVVHPDYSGRGTWDNDFALIRLHGKSNHAPVKLDDGSLSFGETTSLTAVGWGLTEKKRLSSIPRKLEVKYVSPEKCKEIWALRRKTVTSSMLCGVPAKLPSWEGGVYHGDSGGPLLAQKKNENGDVVGSEVSIGVVSWSLPPHGSNGGFPQVYGRVAAAYPWIQEEMSKPAPRETPIKPAAWMVVMANIPFWTVTAYLVGSQLTLVAVMLPFVMRYSGLERRFGFNFDETLSSLRFALLVTFFLAPVIIRAAFVSMLL